MATKKKQRQAKKKKPARKAKARKPAARSAGSKRVAELQAEVRRLRKEIASLRAKDDLPAREGDEPAGQGAFDWESGTSGEG
jgi:septal ring factor EnvC (AmiA/AmiB activator)